MVSDYFIFVGRNIIINEMASSVVRTKKKAANLLKKNCNERNVKIRQTKFPL